MSKKRKIRCPHCGFLETIKWGIRHGYIRYYCKNCHSYFTDRRVWISDKNKFVRFERWIRGKQSICDLAHESGYSERTLLSSLAPVSFMADSAAREGKSSD